MHSGPISILHNQGLSIDDLPENFLMSQKACCLYSKSHTWQHRNSTHHWQWNTSCRILPNAMNITFQLTSLYHIHTLTLQYIINCIHELKLITMFVLLWVLIAGKSCHITGYCLPQELSIALGSFLHERNSNFHLLNHVTYRNLQSANRTSAWHRAINCWAHGVSKIL